MAGAAGNPELVGVGKWFQQYKDLLEDHEILDVPSHLWNCNESGLKDHFFSTHVIGEVGKPCLNNCQREKLFTEQLPQTPIPPVGLPQ